MHAEPLGLKGSAEHRLGTSALKGSAEHRLGTSALKGSAEHRLGTFALMRCCCPLRKCIALYEQNSSSLLPDVMKSRSKHICTCINVIQA